jgi:hypothetical protein
MLSSSVSSSSERIKPGTGDVLAQTTVFVASTQRADLVAAWDVVSAAVG